jgi:hypothetical protein
MTSKYKYIVIVENKHAPRRIHDSLESAQSEAMRLAKTEVGHVVIVAQVLNRMIGKVNVVDYDEVIQ